MTSQIKEIPSLQVSLCSMIRSFFETLNADQVLLLLSGTMDDTTRPLLLQLISNIINNLSSALQTRVMEMDAEVTEELVVSSLGNAVTESFKAALDVKAQGQSCSAETLRDMISQEVMVSVQCSMSDTPKEHVTSAKRLDSMLNLVTRMIRAIKKKMSTACVNEEVLELEEPATSGQPIGYLYRAENMDDISEQDTNEVSSTNEQTCCWYNYASCSWDDITEYTRRSRLFLRDEYLCNEKVMSTVEEKGSGSSSIEFYFPSAEFEKEAVVSLAASPDLSLEEIRKNRVLLVVERLVSLTYASNGVKHYRTHPAIIIERLMTRTWAAVEDVDFEYSTKTYANLEKTIFKDLVKKWGGEALVLVYMKLGSPALEKFVANAIKARLTAQPEKRSCI